MWTWQGFNMQFFKKLWGRMCIASNILDSKSKYDEYMILVIHVLQFHAYAFKCFLSINYIFSPCPLLCPCPYFLRKSVSMLCRLDNLSLFIGPNFQGPYISLLNSLLLICVVVECPEVEGFIAEELLSKPWWEVPRTVKILLYLVNSSTAPLKISYHQKELLY